MKKIVDWNHYVRYEDGVLYWKPLDGNDKATKIWNARFAGKKAGSKWGNGYMRIGFNCEAYTYHRVVWEMHYGPLPDSIEITHINGNPADNRISNLKKYTREGIVRRCFGTSRGWYYNEKVRSPRKYKAARTHKLFGTPCGAYMSFATAFVQGD